MQQLFLSLFMISMFVLSSTGRADKPIAFGIETLPPFNYENIDGRPDGPGIEMARKICKSLNRECRFNMYPVKRLLVMISKNELDGIITLGKNESRMKSFYFSRPYTKSEYGFFVLKGPNAKIHDVEKFNGYKVVTLYGSNMLKTLENLKKKPAVDFEIVTELTLEKAFKKLSNGRYQTDKVVIFANRDIGLFLMRNMNITNLRYTASQNQVHYYVGFPKKEGILPFVQAFTDEMDKLYENGGLADILERNFMIMPDEIHYMN